MKFSTLFAEQCSLIARKSVLPSQLTLLTENTLASCHFYKKNILQIIRNLESNKTHGPDMIYVQTLWLLDLQPPSDNFLNASMKW